MRNALATAILTAGLLAAAGSAFASEIAGNWKDPDNGAVVNFYDCGGDLCGKILTASKPGLRDEKNPDEAKRSQPLDGLSILDHAKKSDDGSWKGNLYNAADGKTYAGYVSLPTPDKLQLKGCALVVFCKSVLFDKVAAK
jgi:uncharacterized protein (DUF2147 family)